MENCHFHLVLKLHSKRWKIVQNESGRLYQEHLKIRQVIPFFYFIKFNIFTLPRVSVGVLHGGSNFYVCRQILRCDHSNKNLFVRTFTYMGFFVFHHFTQQSLKIFTLARLEKSTFCFQVSASKQPVHNIRMGTLKWKLWSCSFILKMVILNFHQNDRAFKKGLTL